MKKLILALVVTLLSLTLTPKGAHAAPKAARTDSLGLEALFHVQVAPLAVPTDAHPWGTAALAWHESAPDGTDLHVGEWDLAAARMVRSRIVRRESLGSRTVSLAHTGTTLLVLTGDVSSSDCELLRLDADLRVRDHLALGSAWLPSLAADDRFIVTGTFETGGYHVRLIDPTTFAVLTVRTLSVAPDIAPWPSPSRSSHALRLDGGRLYVSLPDRDTRVLSLRLPTLATEASITVPIPNEHRWAYSSVPLDPAGAPLGFESTDDGHVLLAPDLSSYRRTKETTLPPWAPGAPSGMGERTSARAHGRTVITGVTKDKWVIAVSQ